MASKLSERGHLQQHPKLLIPPGTYVVDVYDRKLSCIALVRLLLPHFSQFTVRVRSMGVGSPPHCLGDMLTSQQCHARTSFMSWITRHLLASPVSTSVQGFIQEILFGGGKDVTKKYFIFTSVWLAVLGHNLLVPVTFKGRSN